MPPRSRRDKSASISSAGIPAVNGIMGPPSPIAQTSNRSSPSATRRKAPSISKATPGSVPVPKTAHGPAKVSNTSFVAVIVTSLLAQSAARFIFNTGELGLAANHEPSWYQIGGQLTWKILLQGICWYGGYDGEYFYSCAH